MLYISFVPAILVVFLSPFLAYKIIPYFAADHVLAKGAEGLRLEPNKRGAKTFQPASLKRAQERKIGENHRTYTDESGVCNVIGQIRRTPRGNENFRAVVHATARKALLGVIGFYADPKVPLPHMPLRGISTESRRTVFFSPATTCIHGNQSARSENALVIRRARHRPAPAYHAIGLCTVGLLWLVSVHALKGIAFTLAASRTTKVVQVAEHSQLIGHRLYLARRFPRGTLPTLFRQSPKSEELVSGPSTTETRREAAHGQQVAWARLPADADRPAGCFSSGWRFFGLRCSMRSPKG